MTYKNITKPGMVMHTGNPSTQEAKMKKKKKNNNKVRVHPKLNNKLWGQPELQSKTLKRKKKVTKK